MRALTVILTLLFCVSAYGSARDPSNFFYRVSPANAGLKIEPVYYAPKPKYSLDAQKNHLEGNGLFEIHVRPNGTVQSVKVAKSIGHSALDRAAIDAFRRWRFRPNSIGVVRIPIQYTLKPFRAGSGRGLKDIGDADPVVVVGGGTRLTLKLPQGPR